MQQVQVSLRIPDELKKRLKTEASRREISVSALATAILKEGLTIYEDQEVVVRRKFEIFLEPQEVEKLETLGYELVERRRPNTSRGPRLPVYAGPS